MCSQCNRTSPPRTYCRVQGQDFATSRRSFLKLFGAGVAMAAMPPATIAALETLAPAGTELKLSLEPSVFYGKYMGEWTPLGILQNIDLPIEHVPIERTQIGLGGVVKRKGTLRPNSLTINLLLGPGHPYHFDDLSTIEEFAIVIDDLRTEFKATMMAQTIRSGAVDGLAETSLRVDDVRDLNIEHHDT